MRYVSIDTETTGLDSNWCQVLEVGAVLDDFDKPMGSSPTPPFHCYVVHDRIVGQPAALAMNAEILQRIADREKLRDLFTFLSYARVATEFVHWLVLNSFRHNDPVVFAAKNFLFDWNFLCGLPEWEKKVRKRHRTLDPGPLYFDPTRDDAPPGLGECLKRAGLPPDVKHNALDDARDVIRCLRSHYLGSV